MSLVAHTLSGNLVLRITDDGAGASVLVQGGGQGLLNVRRRIERWGGSVRVDAARPQGTTVVIAFPLDEARPKG